MPLSRYEIRSEYSLANPDLYRVADKDDPEGLLEGVAMAGLVGIIRLLGDLAEFAAEVFHDLHEDILATAARGHEVRVRIQHLETQVPLIEKVVLTKNDPTTCLYNPGLEWHPYIHNEQNHFTQGDLPRFIRSAYEDCRSPPRLFTLDRFEGAEAGSCLKRFTDPSFFKTEWANSELIKAEKEQRDQKAQRMKRKRERRGFGEAELASHIEIRMTMEVESKETSVRTSSASDSSLDSAMQAAVDSLMQENDYMLSASGSLFSEKDRLQSQNILAKDFEVKELLLSSIISKTEHETLDTASPVDVGLARYTRNDAGKREEVIADDSASDADNFMDAVTTMESEVETDTEVKARSEMDGEVVVETVSFAFEPQTGEAERDNVVTEDQGHVVEEEHGHAEEHYSIMVDDKKHRHAEENYSTMRDDKEHSNAEENYFMHDKGVFMEEDKEGPVLEEGVASGEHICEMSLDTEFTHFVEGSSELLAEQEKSLSVGGSRNTTSALDSDASIPKFVEEIDTKLEGDIRDNIPTVLTDEGDSTFVVKRAITLSLKDDVPTLESQSNGSSSFFEEDAVLSPERYLQSGVASLVLDTQSIDNSSEKKSWAVSDQLPEPESKSPESLGVASTRRRWQISKLFSKEILASDLERKSIQATESEQSESPRKLSLHSSPSSSIQPMKWSVDFSKSYHTDDEMEGMQVSSVSPSSSSTLSSPRPSTLATTLVDISLDLKPQEPVDAPPSVHLSNSVDKIIPDKLVPPVQTTAEPFISLGSARSFPCSSSSAEQPFFDFIQPVARNHNTLSPECVPDDVSVPTFPPSYMKVSPPPPPLPPLAWRVMKRTRNTAVNAQNPMESSTSIPASVHVQALPSEPSQAFSLSTTVPSVNKPDQLTEAFSTLTTGKSTTVPSVNKPDQLTEAFSTLTTGKSSLLKHEGLHVESMQSFHCETGVSDLEPCGMTNDLAETSECTRIHDGEISFNAIADIHEREELSAFVTSEFGGKIVTAETDRGLEENFIDLSSCKTSPALPTDGVPSSLDDSRLESQIKAAGEHGPTALQRSNLLPVLASKTQVERSMQASTSEDMSRLKLRSKWTLTSSTASSDDREVLLDQIRTRSFNLRNMGREKLAAPRPVTNVNVAAILEKANSIRQAFAGTSDEDDDEWSDA